MAQHRSRKRSACANLRLPSELSSQLLLRLNELSPSLKTDYLLNEVFSKFVSKETDSSEVRRNRAIFKWLCAERDNEATNERLLLTHEEYNILPRVSFDRFISHCRDVISDIIGETAPIEALIGTFSGGASTSRKRTESHPASKYLGEAHVTKDAFELFFDIVVEELPTWFLDGDISFKIVPGNVMFTVPKKTDIDRVACKEPDINMFMQKGIGTHFRKCLRRVGINLNDQSINRSLAREGSITGNLATLDLSSASDSVTTGLVQLLLPECWYSLLATVRSPVTRITPEYEHVNQMFSSMGNGFTFELESLLFYAITRTVNYFRGTPGRVSIYGDDIICPTESVDYVVFALNYLGFQVNPDKSFTSGPFRESCGGHYHDGTDITPFYVKAPIEKLTDLIDVANKLRQWARFDSSGGILNPEVEPIWLWLKGMIPSYLWGGEDTSFKYQLASHDAPSKRLSEETKRRSTGKGGYFHWLNATWDREQVTDGVATSGRTDGSGYFRLRNVHRFETASRLPDYFYHEIV